MEANESLIFKSIPSSMPIEGEHLVIEQRPIDLTTHPEHDGLLVKNLYFSLDPYLRGRMRRSDVESYSPAFALNHPIRNSTISEVMTSGNVDYEKGDLIIIYMEGHCQQYTLLTKDEIKLNVTKLHNPYKLDPIYFLGPLGMPGLTAYSSFHEIGQPKEGETIFVSAASGAVGALVGQLAKRAGLKVIGSVGDDMKAKYVVDELGFDDAFNYKRESPHHALQRLAPEGVDIYFENVGGAHLEAALSSLKLFGRIVVCGMIVDYNKSFTRKYGVRNLQAIFEKRIRMQGFIVADLQERYHEKHQRDCQRWIKEGSLKVKISETVGMENAVGGLLGLFEGLNFGKAVLRIW